jgi:hypothetical protein
LDILSDSQKSISRWLLPMLITCKLRIQNPHLAIWYRLLSCTLLVFIPEYYILTLNISYLYFLAYIISDLTFFYLFSVNIRDVLYVNAFYSPTMVHSALIRTWGFLMLLKLRTYV